ncbi:MAG: his Kinase domain protein [Thermoleophilia bacterium]|nr:his Kinase domain protein [Thermoleophilia bacterium]
MPPRDRSQRTVALSPWARRVDALILPGVVLLLLLGAAFVTTAWSRAEDTVAASQAKDELRADRVATAVSTVVERQWKELEGWSASNAALLQPGREDELRRALADRVDGGSLSATVAWAVVRADGRVAAIGESVPGQVSANGVADDLLGVGRRIASRNEPQASDRLRFGDAAVYAAGVPVPRPGNPKVHDAVIIVDYLDRSPIGTFLDSSAKGEVDELTLLDARRHVMVGVSSFASAERVSRKVGRTGWSLDYTREEPQTLVPRWTYPAFAALLVVFSLVYALQDSRRRRLRRVGAERLREVQLLYRLAERSLHADAVEQQAEDLVRSAHELVSIDGSCVDVTVVGQAVQRQSGHMEPTDHVFRAPVSGPREPLGELVVSRARRPFDDEERWVVQTAATLAGAAMHTREALETERQAGAELQRLDELRSNLLATVAHELLSPLTAVKGVLDLLSMQDDLGHKGREYVGVATEGTDRLVALIRDLFDCSLLETGQLDIRPRRQLASELLDGALGAQVTSRMGELRISATANLMITVDPVRFDQLVNNLVTNAFRHGAPPVEVAVRPADGGAVVVVSDEGPGIAAGDRDEIFGKFWQGSTGHARAVQGAGLGLSLVQGLVELHGGHITIDSTHADGRGARFTAYFPDVVPVRGAAEAELTDRPAAIA